MLDNNDDVKKVHVPLLSFLPLSPSSLSLLPLLSPAQPPYPLSLSLSVVAYPREDKTEREEEGLTCGRKEDEEEDERREERTQDENTSLDLSKEPLVERYGALVRI